MRTLLSFIFAILLVQSVHADIKFLSISDIHYGSANKPGDGHDTGDALFSAAFNKFSQLSNQVDFILTLGDLPEHQLIHSSNREHNIKKVLQALYQANSAHKPLFYIPGNNDSLHGNYQPFSWEGRSPLTLSAAWKKSCIHCDDLLIDATQMQKNGYYSTYVSQGNKDILLIALNSTPFAELPLWHYYSHQDRDAEEQLAWLETQLKSTHAKQLLIAMHIPPGNNLHGRPLWQAPYLKKFIALLSTYASHYGEVNLLTGHTHMDDIRKIQLPNALNIYVYATPSISRIYHNYPAMKVFSLDSTLKLQNYTTLYTVNDSTWSNTYYQAKNAPDSLFPQCQHESLSMCLNTMNPQALCEQFKKGLFYGAKSPNVDNTACQLTYLVSSK